MKARIGKCFLTSQSHNPNLNFLDECIRVSRGKNVLLLGDSHAAQYYSSFVQYFDDSNISQLNASGCRPIISYLGKGYCTDLMKRAFEEYLHMYNFDLVVLSGRWNAFDLSGLIQTIKYLQLLNIEVILIGPVVEYMQPLPNLLSRFENDRNFASRASIYENRSELNSKLKEVATLYEVKYASPIDVMCPKQTKESCITTLENGDPIQFDKGHLTHNGALFIIRNIFSLDWQLKT
nr:SGNH hydrolase domain-containing protein [Paraglaciecola arctica]